MVQREPLGVPSRNKGGMLIRGSHVSDELLTGLSEVVIKLKFLQVVPSPRPPRIALEVTNGLSST